MPFVVAKVPGGYKVKNSDTGKFYSDEPHKKASEAYAQKAAMEANGADENKDLSLSAFQEEIANAARRQIRPNCDPGNDFAVPIPADSTNMSFGYIDKIFKDYFIFEYYNSRTLYRASWYRNEAGEIVIGEPCPVDVVYTAATTPTVEEKRGFLDSMFKELRKIVSGAITQESEPVSVFKDKTGRWRWILMSSNAYRDLDKEIVSTKALQADVDLSDLTGQYGPLRWWHTKGMDIGDCDFRMLHGKTLIESGTFRDESFGPKIAKKAKELQVSIGFNHPASEPDADGVFNTIKTFERSLVPRGRVANPLTNVFVKGDEMANLKEKLEAFKSLLNDPSLVEKVLSQASAAEKSADAAGTAFKAKDELPEEETEKGKAAADAAKKLGKTAEPVAEEEIAETAEEEAEDDEDEEVFPFAKGKKKESNLADMSVQQFGDLMADVFTEALIPALKELNAPVVTTEKDSRIAELEAKNAMLEARLKELEPATPRAFRASEDASTIQDEGSKLKGAGPANDPVADFMQFAIGSE